MANRVAAIYQKVVTQEPKHSQSIMKKHQVKHQLNWFDDANLTLIITFWKLTRKIPLENIRFVKLWLRSNFIKNDDPGLTLTYFTGKVKFCNLGFSIGKSENSGFWRNYCSQQPESW